MKLGTVVTLPNVALAELTASYADFVWIDLEHGALDRGHVQPLAIAARSAGAESFVRIGSAADAALGPVLDAGVDGIVVPRVDRAEEAELIVDRLRHPPRGSRGQAARRSSGYGRGRADRDPRCIVQIESETGAAEANRIAAVEGVDALIVGCADLAADVGEGSARLREAIARVQGACSAAGIAFGIAGPDDPRPVVNLCGAPPDVIVLAADVRVYARALDEHFGAVRRLRSESEQEADVCA